MRDRFAIYVGRIDENKGCVELFEFFEHYSAGLADGMHLVLVGTAHVPIPKHPRIHHLGFLEDQDKYDAMAAAELLIMPSYLESLSMVALEAWAMGKPVLANAKCDVLQGQCLRSNAGLFYANYPEFAETMGAIDTTPSLQAALGRNGRAFFEKHYAWPVIEKKYVDMLQQLSKETATRTMEAMPGWFARRRKSQPPADDVVKGLPSGPYKETTAARSQATANIARPASESRPQPRPPQQQPFDSAQGKRPPQQPPLDPAQARRPQQGQRPDQRNFRDSRGPRPDNRPPRTDNRPGGDAGQVKPRTEGQKTDRGRDHRRGRPQRRGRRPGGGGGAR
jgi:hypothetical protein